MPGLRTDFLVVSTCRAVPASVLLMPRQMATSTGILSPAACVHHDHVIHAPRVNHFISPFVVTASLLSPRSCVRRPRISFPVQHNAARRLAGHSSRMGSPVSSAIASLTLTLFALALTLKHKYASSTSYVLVFVAMDLMAPTSHAFLLCVLSTVSLVVPVFITICSELPRAFFNCSRCLCVEVEGLGFDYIPNTNQQQKTGNQQPTISRITIINNLNARKEEVAEALRSAHHVLRAVRDSVWERVGLCDTSSVCHLCRTASEWLPSTSLWMVFLWEETSSQPKIEGFFEQLSLHLDTRFFGLTGLVRVGMMTSGYRSCKLPTVVCKIGENLVERFRMLSSSARLTLATWCGLVSFVERAAALGTPMATLI